MHTYITTTRNTQHLTFTTNTPYLLVGTLGVVNNQNQPFRLLQIFGRDSGVLILSISLSRVLMVPTTLFAMRVTFIGHKVSIITINIVPFTCLRGLSSHFNADSHLYSNLF